VWLAVTNSSTEAMDYHPGVEVNCRSEMVLPLLNTVSLPVFHISTCWLTTGSQYLTQRPCEYFITIVDDLAVPEFIVLTQSVIEYIISIPKKAQTASGTFGKYPWIEIRAGEVDDHNVDFVHRHRAEFMMDVEEISNRLYFEADVSAVTRIDREQAGPDSLEVVNTFTRHELGLYE
jgi:hypothetical protein